MAYLEQFDWSRGYTPPTHLGVDIACPYGTSLPALESGQVQFAGWITFTQDGRTYRELIVIVQSNGFFISYGHLQSKMVNAGQRVERGQEIAVSGNSGFVLPPPTPQKPWSGAHLHIEELIGTKDPNKPLSAYQTRDITPRLNAYGGEDMTNEEHAKQEVRLLADVIEGNPHYEEQHPDAFNGHVQRILNSKDPLEDRKVGHDFMNNYKATHGGDQQKEIDEALIHMKTATQILEDA